MSMRAFNYNWVEKEFQCTSLQSEIPLQVVGSKIHFRIFSAKVVTHRKTPLRRYRQDSVGHRRNGKILEDKWLRLHIRNGSGDKSGLQDLKSNKIFINNF